jgi:hypothetical protein
MIWHVWFVIKKELVGILGIDGMDKDDLRNNQDTRTTEKEVIETQEAEHMRSKEPGINQSNGIVGDDGIDIREDNDGRSGGSNEEKNDNKDPDNDGSTTNQLLTDHHNTNSQTSKTNSNNQMRKAVSTSVHFITTNVSQVSQVSHCPQSQEVSLSHFDYHSHYQNHPL